MAPPGSRITAGGGGPDLEPCVCRAPNVAVCPPARERDKGGLLRAGGEPSPPGCWQQKSTASSHVAIETSLTSARGCQTPPYFSAAILQHGREGRVRGRAGLEGSGVQRGRGSAGEARAASAGYGPPSPAASLCLSAASSKPTSGTCRLSCHEFSIGRDSRGSPGSGVLTALGSQGAG